MTHSSQTSGSEGHHGDWMLRAVGWKRKTHINNQSGANAYVVISNHRVALLKHLEIDNVGGLDLEHTGDGDKTQEFRVMAYTDRKVRLHTYNFYVTAYLFIDSSQKWMQLWENRLFRAAHDINLLPRHVDEAKFDAGSKPTLGRTIAKSIDGALSGMREKKPKNKKPRGGKKE